MGSAMRFQVPNSADTFDIEDDWWKFCEMTDWVRQSEYFPPSRAYAPVATIALVLIEPPRRAPGISLFRKEKLVPILLSFRSPECALPPIEIETLPGAAQYRFRVLNGCHRYYASAAVGYTKIPVLIGSSPASQR